MVGQEKSLIHKTRGGGGNKNRAGVVWRHDERDMYDGPMAVSPPRIQRLEECGGGWASCGAPHPRSGVWPTRERNRGGGRGRRAPFVYPFLKKREPQPAKE